MTKLESRILQGQYLIQVSRVQTFSVVANSPEEAREMCLDGVLLVDQIGEITTIRQANV
jgi:hypothetical protein